MKYNFLFLGLWICCSLGCQTMPTEHGDGTPFRAESQRSATPDTFLGRAAQLLLPETEAPRTQVVSRPTRSVPTAEDSFERNSDPNFDPNFDQNAYQTAWQNSYVNQYRRNPYFGVSPYGTPNMFLGNQQEFGSPVSAEEWAMQGTPDHFPTQAEPETKNENSGNFLVAQKGDSVRFRQFLKKLRETPREDWMLDSEEVEKRITIYRETMDLDPDRESVYLAFLQKDILSTETKPVKNHRAPLDESESDWQLASSGDSGYRDVEYGLGDDSDSLPPPRPLSVNRTRNTRQLGDERYAAREPQPLPAPIPQGPKYGTLAQLDTAPSNASQPVLQAGYRDSYGTPGRGEVVTANCTPHGNSPHGIPSQVDGDWRSQVRTGLEMLRREMNQTPGNPKFADEGSLRFLELALGNRHEAVRPFQSADRSFNEFFANQMLGFSSLFDETSTPDRRARYTAAAYRFDEGLMELRQLCPLQLKNVQIVRDWVTFAVFLPKTEDCRPGEEVGLYLELDNPTIRRSNHGFNVRASLSYEIRDSGARIVEKKDNISAEETSPSQKRDYCIHCPIQLPPSLAPGQYQLRVNVTDMNSEGLQYAEEQISFRVASGRDR